MRRMFLAAVGCLAFTATASAQVVQQQIVGDRSIGVQIVEDPSWWRTQQHNEVLLRDLYRRDAADARRDRYQAATNARQDREIRDLEVQAARLDERQKAQNRELDRLWEQVKSHKHTCACDPCRRHEHLNYSWHTHYGYNWYPGWGYSHARYGAWR